MNDDQRSALAKFFAYGCRMDGRAVRASQVLSERLPAELAAPMREIRQQELAHTSVQRQRSLELADWSETPHLETYSSGLWNLTTEGNDLRRLAATTAVIEQVSIWQFIGLRRCLRALGDTISADVLSLLAEEERGHVRQEIENLKYLQCPPRVLRDIGRVVDGINADDPVVSGELPKRFSFEYIPLGGRAAEELAWKL